MIGDKVQIPCYKNRLCICQCIHPFYFRCLFLSNRWAYLDQSWHEGVNWQWLYKYWKSGSLVTQSGFHIIKSAVYMSLFSILLSISQQTLCQFGPILAGRWVLSMPLWILEISMIDLMVRISYNKKKLFVFFSTFSSPISQQPFAWYGPDLVGRWVLLVTL